MAGGVRVVGRLDAGQRVECYADEEALLPYLRGSVAKVTATSATVKVIIEVDQPQVVATVEEEPEESSPGFPRPKGWT